MGGKRQKMCLSRGRPLPCLQRGNSQSPRATKAKVCSRGRRKGKATKTKTKIRETKQLKRFGSKIKFFKHIANHSEKKKIFGKVVPSWQ